MDHLTALRNEIFTKQHVLAKIYNKNSKQSLADYVSQWPIYPLADSSVTLFGKSQSASLAGLPAASLSLVSTIDHHGILNHPFFLNSNLIYSLRPGLDNLICLSTAGVSFNNSSWPGCLLVTGLDGKVHRFSFFADKIKTRPVLAARAFGPGDLQRVLGHIGAADFLPEASRQKLLGIMEDVFHDPELFEAADFSRQASIVSSALWAKVFPGAPKLFYIPLEKVVSDFIANEALPRPDHILHKLLFTSTGWDILEKYFSGSLGAFGFGHKGSFLFWGIDDKGHRRRLANQDGRLVCEGLSIPADAQAIVQGIQTGKLYPSSLVCFLALLCTGMTCLGGFNQVNWLTEIKTKFVELLNQTGEKQLAESIAKIPTENFSEGSLAFGINSRGEIYKPTLLDLLLQDDAGLYGKYKKLAEQITVGESLDAQLPEIYKIITPEALRTGKFLAITQEDILKTGSLGQKIRHIF